MILFSSAGFSFNPGILTSFPANTIPYVNASQELSYDSLFTYQSGNLGVGVSTSLQGRLHVRGASNSSTSKAAYFQSLDNEILSLYNNRQVVFGGGSAFTNTDFTFNAFTVGGDVDSRIVGYFKDSSTDTVVRIMNTPGFTRGGLEIARSSTSAGRNALRIFGGTTANLTITSNGVITFDTANAYQDTGVTYIQRSSTTYTGLLFNLDNTEAANFTFHKGRTLAGLQNNLPLVDINNTFSDNGQTYNGTIINLGIRPTYNYTGLGTVNATGIDYNPTVTNLNGLHIGARIRAGLSGFGLGSDTPTAFVDVAASATDKGSLRIRPGVTPTGGALVDGLFIYDGTNLFFRQGGTTRTIQWI